jgi:hypothetical protein
MYSQSYALIVSEIPVSGSELAYEPELWNYSPVQQSTNCYAYALNNQLDPKNSAFGCNYTDYNPKQQPGEFYNANREATDPAIDTSDFENDPSLLVTAVQKDYEMYNNLFGTDLIFMPIDRDATCPNGTYKVALYVRPSSSETIADYHWYRQDADGLWSHKIGPTAAKQVDESSPGNLIVAPDTANRGGYSIFVGYFAISPWNHLYCATTTSEVEREIAAISTSSTLNVYQAQIDTIELGMHIEQVIDIIGFSGRDIGSGIIIHEYTTYTGSQLLISYTMDGNGSFIVSKICNGISISN